MKLKYIYLLIFTSLISGCATTENYKKALDSWVGSHADRLVSVWGPPQNYYKNQDGSMVLEYVREGKITIGGNSYVTPKTSYNSGTFNVSNGINTTHGSYTGSTTSWVREKSQQHDIPLFCRTIIKTNSLGYIKEWSFNGNNCVARAPKLAEESTTKKAETPQLESEGMKNFNLQGYNSVLQGLKNTK